MSDSEQTPSPAPPSRDGAAVGPEGIPEASQTHPARRRVAAGLRPYVRRWQVRSRRHHATQPVSEGSLAGVGQAGEDSSTRATGSTNSSAPDDERGVWLANLLFDPTFSAQVKNNGHKSRRSPVAVGVVELERFSHAASSRVNAAAHGLHNFPGISGQTHRQPVVSPLLPKDSTKTNLFGIPPGRHRR